MELIDKDFARPADPSKYDVCHMEPTSHFNDDDAQRQTVLEGENKS
jgi:hypothetical protein